MSKVRAAPLVVTVELGVSRPIYLPDPAFADEGGHVVMAEAASRLAEPWAVRVRSRALYAAAPYNWSILGITRRREP